MTTVAGIALRPAAAAPMQVVDTVECNPEEGLVGDYGRGRRQVTLITEELWKRALAELGADLPWHTRRANLLTRGLALDGLLDRRLSVGDAIIEIGGVTHPCELMDRFHAGLRAALDKELRCGVYGRVLTGGTIRVGSAIEIIDGV